MKIESHKKTLGIIHIVYGLSIGITFILIGSATPIFYPFLASEIAKNADNNSDDILSMVNSISKSTFVLLLIFSPLPSVIGGIGLIQKKTWGIVITLIAGGISIFSIPFGTALGVYSFYVLLIRK